MSFKNEFNLNLDIKKRVSHGVPTFRKGDSAKINFRIFDNGEGYDLTDYTRSEITFHLPSGRIMTNTCVLVGNVVEYVFNGVEFEEIGDIKVLLSIYSNESRVSVQPFKIHVYDTIRTDDISYISILQDLQEQTQELKMEIIPLVDRVTVLRNDIFELSDYIEEKEIERDNGENERNDNENQRIFDENERIQEESIREENESQRITNEDNRQTKETDRVSAEVIRVANESNRVINTNLAIDRLNTVVNNFDYKGTYSSSMQYAKHNIVQYNGDSYGALKNVRAITPIDDGENWQLIARKGIDGTGSVAKVNGISPNGNGEVTLPIIVASDVQPNAQTVDGVWFDISDTGFDVIDIENAIVSNTLPSDTSKLWMQENTQGNITLKKFANGEWKTLNPKTNLNQVIDQTTNKTLPQMFTEIDDKIQTLDSDTSQKLNQIIINLDNYERLHLEINDNGRFIRAFNDLKVNGGKLLIPSVYTISTTLAMEIQNDVNIILIGSPTSLINATTLSNVISISSEGNIGNVEIYNVNISAESVPTAWDTYDRMQGITIQGCKSVKIQHCKIKKLYGTGILLLNNLAIDVSHNILSDVRGYDQTLDSYGDGIYIAQNTSVISIKQNIIINEISETKRCGRIGITLEFNVANAIIEGNYISGYNRGIHSELTYGGHRIVNNVIKACYIPFVSLTEMGTAKTIVENNTFSNEGFIAPSNPILFYKHFIQIGASESGHTPKLEFKNNKIMVVGNEGFTNTLGLQDSFSINRDFVDVEGNELIVASDVNGKNLFAGSRSNVNINKNKLKNVGTVTLWYQKKGQFNDNEVECVTVLTDRAQLSMNNNTFRPQDGHTTIGSIIKNRPEGTFNNNTIYDYGSETIDNTSYSTNDFQFEVSGNTFVRTKLTTPLLPTIITSGNFEACDVLFTNIPNDIVDNINSENNRNLVFYNSVHIQGGKKIMWATSVPQNRQWNLGDIVYNNNPQVGQPFAWECITSGMPGSWQSIGIVGQTKIENKADSVATTVDSLRVDFNDLLARLKTAGLM